MLKARRSVPEHKPMAVHKGIYAWHMRPHNHCKRSQTRIETKRGGTS